MNLGNDNRFNIWIDQIPGNLERFAEDAESKVATYKSDQYDVSIRDILDYRYLRIWAERSYRKLALFDYLWRSLAFQVAVPVMPVMEALEILALPF